MPRPNRALLRSAVSPSGLIRLFLLVSGILALICSVIFTSRVLAFIGLGLTFWGVLLSYLTRERYIRSVLFDSTSLSSLEVLCEVIAELDYRGKAMYLPPRYLKDFKSGILYVPKKQEVRIPVVGDVSDEKTFSKSPNGLCIAPSGLSLANLFERELGTDFVRVNLQYLRNNLPRILIENLEISQEMEINIEGSLVKIRFIDSIYKGFCHETRKFSKICNSIGCPLCSSMACVLSRTMGKPVVIEKNECSEKGRVIDVHYRILGEQ